MSRATEGFSARTAMLPRSFVVCCTARISLCRASESRCADPKTFLPSTARGHRLEVLVRARLRKIEGVRDGSHRLETDKVSAGRRVDHGNRILRAIADRDRSEEHTSELQANSFISYAVFC